GTNPPRPAGPAAGGAASPSQASGQAPPPTSPAGQPAPAKKEAEGSQAAPSGEKAGEGQGAPAAAEGASAKEPASANEPAPAEGIDPQQREAEKKVFEEKAREEGKPDHIVEKIVQGQLDKWASEVALLDQTHVNAEKHDSKTIEELRQELAAKTGENIQIG